MRKRPRGCRAGVRCACGTLASDGGALCEKCACRARWLRRKSHRAFPGE